MLLEIVLLVLLMVGSGMVGGYVVTTLLGTRIGNVLQAARDTGVLTEDQLKEVVDLMDTVR
jgi:hypothetical protein